VGERVKRDEPILEISTDKVDAEIPSPSAGVLTEIEVGEGKTVEIKTVLGKIETDAGAAAREERPAAAAPPPRAEPPVAPASPPAAAPAGAGAPSGEEQPRKRSSPLVRRIAREHRIDISALPGTGTGGRVTKKDIEAYLESAQAAPPPAPRAPVFAPGVPAFASGVPAFAPGVPALAPGERVRIEPLSVMRRKIAEHMLSSKRTSAHVHSFFEVDYTPVDRIRRERKDAFLERNGVKLTYLPFILHAVVEALKAWPVLNASVEGDNLVTRQDINLGVAVALDWGLIVPVIKSAQEKNLAGLARATADLAERARTRKLLPDEVQGGTFTITNPGVFGSLFGTPIINQPQLAILGVGVIERRLKVVEDTLAIRTMGYLAIGFDHRIIDGAVADQFMAHIKKTLENFDPRLV
jgi:pyruvate dehydrogenase E2 component (dihydrolipoyllysine-residue acetyltransferase)